MSEHLARLPEDQPEPWMLRARAAADGARALQAEADRAGYGRPDPLARPTDGGDLVPGYGDSGDGQADAADQSRWDGRR